MADLAEYKDAIHKLLPSGSIWPGVQEDCVLNTFIEVVANAVKGIKDDADTESDDIFPDSASPGNYIEDWERVLQLPKNWADITFQFLADVGKCGEPLSITTIKQFFPSTDSDRRDAIVSFLNTSRENNEQYYLDLCTELGFTATVATTGAAYWRITVTAGDLSKIDTLISLAQFLKPAHTKLEVIY